jgi:hypothetical protein
MWPLMRIGEKEVKKSEEETRDDGMRRAVVLDDGVWAYQIGKEQSRCLGGLPPAECSRQSQSRQREVAKRECDNTGNTHLLSEFTPSKNGRMGTCNTRTLRIVASLPGCRAAAVSE